MRNPTLAKVEANKHLQRISAYIPHDVGIQGSYWTTNIGDRAIGEVLKTHFENEGYNTRLFSKDISHSNSSYRILGGGGVLHDWYGADHLRKRLNFLQGSGAIIGVGVPGIRSEAARNLIVEKLEGVDPITVRDERSKGILQPLVDNDVRVTACPALLHSDPNTPNQGATGVNFRPWFNLDQETLSYYFDYDLEMSVSEARAQYIQNARDICNHLDNPVFIPFHKTDERFARENLPIEVKPFEFSVQKTLERVSSVRRMVTMRYHSLLFATICQKPVLPINYDPKVSCFAERIGVSSYPPHQDIPIEFQAITNRDRVQQSAQMNFRYLDESLTQS